MKHFFRYWFANAMSNFNCLSLPCVVGSKPLKKFYSVFSFENVSDLLHNFIDDCWVELCVCRHFCSRYSFDTLSLVVSQVYFDREKCKMLITTRIRIQLALHLILFYSSSLFFWFWVYLFFIKKKFCLSSSMVYTICHQYQIIEMKYFICYYYLDAFALEFNSFSSCIFCFGLYSMP